MPKPILCLDFDGVIHRYSHGWQGGRIYDTITEGFFEWAQEAKEHFELVIYSSRSKSPNGLTAMHEWLYRQWLSWSAVQAINFTPRIFVSDPINSHARMDFTFAHEKPPAFLTIDDRAVCFQGSWKHPSYDPELLLQFKPWTQRKDPSP